MKAKTSTHHRRPRADWDYRHAQYYVWEMAGKQYIETIIAWGTLDKDGHFYEDREAVSPKHCLTIKIVTLDTIVYLPTRHCKIGSIGVTWR